MGDGGLVPSRFTDDVAGHVQYNKFWPVYLLPGLLPDSSPLTMETAKSCFNLFVGLWFGIMFGNKQKL